MIFINVRIMFNTVIAAVGVIYYAYTSSRLDQLDLDQQVKYQKKLQRL